MSQTSSSSNQKKAMVLSPFKKSPTTPTQNRFAPITPSSPNLSYSALVKSPVAISQISQNSTPNRSMITLQSNTVVTPFSQKTSPKPSSSYVANPNEQTVKILEDYEVQLHSQGFSVLTDFLFPRNSLFIRNVQHSREFYEAILVETASIKVFHTQNQRNPSVIDFSKAQILRILSIQDWKARPYAERTLSSPGFSNVSYNYYDYQEAWYNFLYLRSYSHSWFMFFDKSFECNYSRWFVKWFRYAGNISDTFPVKVKQGFEKFKEIFVQDIPEFEYVLQFSMLFKIPWILSWNFSVTPASGASPSLLQRTYRVKWWEKLPAEQVEQITAQGVSNYYSINFGVQPTLTPNLNQDDDEQEIAQFMTANTKEEIRKLIREIKQNSPGSSSTQEIQDEDMYSDVKL